MKKKIKKITSISSVTSLLSVQLIIIIVIIAMKTKIKTIIEITESIIDVEENTGQIFGKFFC